MSILKTCVFAVPCIFIIGFAMYLTPALWPLFLNFRPVLTPFITGLTSFTSNIQSYFENFPYRIIAWFEQNLQLVASFLTIGVGLGGVLGKLISRKNTQKAVDTAKGESAGAIQKLSTEKQQVETDLTASMNRIQDLQKVVDKKDLAIEAYKQEKQAVQDMVDERDQQIVRVSQERDYLARRVAELETELKAKPRVD